MTQKTARSATPGFLVHSISRTVNYNDTGIATGVYMGTLPKGALPLQAGGNIETAFNAGTTNVLTIGTEGDSGLDNLATASTFTEATPGGYSNPFPIPPLAADTDVFIQYTQTGTAATTGKAHAVVSYICRVDNAA